MTTLDNERFDLRSEIFKEKMADFKDKSADDRAWSVLDNRQQEIKDSQVENTKKAEAYDWLLNEVERIFPDSKAYYCKALEQRLIYTDSHNNDALELIAKKAYANRSASEFNTYDKIIYGAYMRSNRKKTFPHANIALKYRKKVIYEKEKEPISDELNKLEYFINDDTGYIPPEKKLQLVKDAIDMITEPPFKKTEAYNDKAAFCDMAVRVCREELFDTETAKEYLAQASEYRRLAGNAYKKWEERHGEFILPKKRTGKTY